MRSVERHRIANLPIRGGKLARTLPRCVYRYTAATNNQVRYLALGSFAYTVEYLAELPMAINVPMWHHPTEDRFDNKRSAWRTSVWYAISQQRLEDGTRVSSPRDLLGQVGLPGTLLVTVYSRMRTTRTCDSKNIRCETISACVTKRHTAQSGAGGRDLETLCLLRLGPIIIWVRQKDTYTRKFFFRSWMGQLLPQGNRQTG